jgi:hypothetical protein
MSAILHLPDYRGTSIVNLMASLTSARGAPESLYPKLRHLEPSTLAEARNLILIVIDGLGYRYLMQQRTGDIFHRCLQARLTSVFPSTTASAISVFLTGLAPQQHALTGWFSYFRELDRVVTVLPFTDRDSGESLTALGIDASELFDHRSVFETIETPSYSVVPEHIADSVFNLTHSRGATIRPYKSLTQFYAAIKRILGEDTRAKYVYAYWPRLDSIAHGKGIQSRASKAHYAELESAFRQFIADIEGSESTVVVTADHGMLDSGAARVIEMDDHPQLAETLARPLCGERRMAYCYVRPHLRERFQNYVSTTLGDYATLLRSEDLIHRGVFGLGPPHPRLHERVGDYALVMKDNYVIKDWLPGEHRHVHIGTHGGVSEEEMYVPLIVATA